MAGKSAKSSGTDTADAGAGAAGAGVETDKVQVHSALSYEQARGELVGVVQKLEAGGATLEESLALWERGEELARICREWLEGARARLDAVLEAEAAAGEDADPEGAEGGSTDGDD
jgi:exodeoxyribonuclease VII small subunit